MPRVNIEGLAAWGQQLISRLGWEEGDSRRVTWSPTPRLIRYYTTLGLLDRPAGFQGRTALYGPRHLLQVLAVKRLQLDGKTLDEIQPLLLGRTDEGLAALLGLTLPLPAPDAPEPLLSGPAPARPADFWKEVPAPRAPAPRPPERPPGPPERPPGRPLTSFEPIQGLQVLIDPARLPAGISPEACIDAIVQACAARLGEANLPESEGPTP